MNCGSLGVCVTFGKAYSVLPGFLDEENVVDVYESVKECVGGSVGLVDIIRKEADGKIEGTFGGV